MDNLQQTVDGYLSHLEHNRRVTEKTLKNYRSTCRQFTDWARRNGRSLNSLSIQEYVGRYDNASSANVALVRLCGLAKFAKVPVEVTRAKEEIPEVVALSSQQAMALVDAAFDISEDIGNSALFLTETGLRFDEFMRAKVKDVRVENGVRFLTLTGKGRKFRRVPLTDAAYKALCSLPPRTTYFEKILREKLAEAGEAADIEFHIHPHLLRATFISILVNEKRIDSAIVAKAVGHANVSTLANRYLQANLDTIAAALN